MNLKERFTRHFASDAEKKRFLEDMYARREKMPLVSQGMGIGFTDGEQTGTAMKKGCIATIAASAGGYNKIVKELAGMRSPKERIQAFQLANEEWLKEQIEIARNIDPNGILLINVMKLVADNRRMIEVAGESGEVDGVVIGAGFADDETIETMKKFPHMEWGPILSMELAIKGLFRGIKNMGNKPFKFVEYEDALQAGGHLGVPEKRMDPANLGQDTILSGFRGFLGKKKMDVPIFLAGGQAYGEDLERAQEMGFDGSGMGTRFLLTKESGMSDYLIRECYLNNRFRVKTAMTSPSGFLSRYIGEAPDDRCNVDELRDRIRDCVRCIDDCHFNPEMLQSADGDGSKPQFTGDQLKDFCIAAGLSLTSRIDNDGKDPLTGKMVDIKKLLLFTGEKVVKVRDDKKLHRPDGPDGKLYVPATEEMLDHVLIGEGMHAAA
jgi:hypothetical protein